MNTHILDKPGSRHHGKQVQVVHRGSGVLRIRTDSSALLFPNHTWAHVGSDVWRGTLAGSPAIHLRPIPSLTPVNQFTKGLRPKYIAYREQDAERAVEIAEAIKRYAAALKPIPKVWLDELHDLIDANQTQE